MPKFEITIRATYIQEYEIEAEDDIEARLLAAKQFTPDSDCITSMDIFGLDPWLPTDGREDYEYETKRQREIDDEA